MRKEGDRNFGVWNPPTGMDSVRQSAQVDLDLIVRLNNFKLGKELGVQQSFKSFSQYPNSDSTNNLNNNSSIIFKRMIQQGWRTQALKENQSPIATVPMAKEYPPPGTPLPMPDFPVF